MGVSEFKEGWVLVVAEFVVVFLTGGISFSFGLFLVAFLDEFGESRVSTAFAGSIGFGVQYVLGPISGSIADRFDSRPPIIIGTLISFAGYLASSFAKSIPVMCVSYGLLGGIGFGLMYLPANACVMKHFTKRRALAHGIALCGNGFGTFACSLLTNYLISEFGWRRALFITSGLLLNGIPCALLLVSPSKEKKQVQHISMQQIQHRSKAKGRAEKIQTTCMAMVGGFKCIVQQITHLIKDRKCICFMMSAFFIGLAFTIPSGILPDQVIQMGMSNREASWLVSSIGLSDVLGRVMFGLVSDKIPMYRRAIFVCMAFLQGISISLMPLFQTFNSKIVLTCTFGLAMGGYVTMFGVVLADEFGTERIGKSYGLNILTFGLSSCFAVPLAGWIFDVSHNYDLAFYVGGGECMMATMCLLSPTIWSYFYLKHTTRT